MTEKLQWRDWKSFPWLVFLLAIVIWVVLASVNFYYQRQGGYTGTGILFPISVIYPNQFLWSGFLFAFLFLFFGILIFRNVERLSIFFVILSAIALIILGNLSQGNFDVAFLQPFYLKGRQYYTDALQINDAGLWLKDFSKNLDHFQLHTKTHPPFVTLLHYGILHVSNIETLAITFLALGCLSFPLFYQILKYLKFPELRIKQMLLLLGIIPSVNIYLLVSIDALVLTSTLLFLLGFARVFYYRKIDSFAFLYIILGLVLTNLLTFSGLYLFAFLGCISFYFLIKGKWSFVGLSLMNTAVFVIVFVLIFALTGYNQLETFRLASQSENPDGFRLFHQPFVYLMTRLEDVSEILLFLSFGFLAVLFSKKSKTLVFGNNDINVMFLSSIIALSAMFLTGAYGTGETARACLFIVPYFLILLKNVDDSVFRIMFYICLFQTFGMQMIGNFYW